MLKLVEITRENWLKVLFLTSNENGMPTLCEEYVASNALSLVQAQFENGWFTKAIEVEDEIVGFTMYGFCEEHNFYELCRIMIDKKYQGKGWGTQAIKLVLEDMKLIAGCREVYLSTDSNNLIGKHVYEKIGFVAVNRKIDDEDLYKYVFSEGGNGAGCSCII